VALLAPDALEAIRKSLTEIIPAFVSGTGDAQSFGGVKGSTADGAFRLRRRTLRPS